MGKRYFGNVRRLPSGRYQARYTGPDGRTYTGRSQEGRALTFDSKTYADAYLSRVDADIQAGRWVSPDAAKAARPVTLAAYAETWLESRDLSPATRLLYANVLKHILPALGGQAADRDHPGRGTGVAREAAGPRPGRRCALTPTRCCARS